MQCSTGCCRTSACRTTLPQTSCCRTFSELGERWERGEVSIAQEHFATNVIREADWPGLAGGWGACTGRLALLACPPGELHELPLMIFGIVLSRDRMAGRVPRCEHPDPGAGRCGAAGRDPELVVVASATTGERFDWRSEPSSRPTRASGAARRRRRGARRDALADGVGARVLVGDPVTAAQNESSGR